MKKMRFIVDATPLIEPRMSGVSHALAGLLAELVKINEFTSKYKVILVVPIGRKKLLKRWEFASSCAVFQMPLPMKIINGLIKYRLLPYMDLLIGKGVYFFPNFRNWPLTKRSFSYTVIHDICYALYPEFVQPRNQQMLIQKVPLFIKQTNVILSVSKTSSQEIRDYYSLSKDQVKTLYNAVDTNLYKKASKVEIEKVKKKLKIPDAYFLFVGNIEPRKNLEKLIDAYLLVEDGVKKKHSLVLVGGDGWLNKKIFEKIKVAQQNGESIIKPDHYIPDNEVVALLSGAAALVHTALHEGFGMPPLEAMATETPVVASDIPVLHEVFQDSCLYVGPGKPASIAAGMTRVVTDRDLRIQLIKKGKERVGRYSWRHSAESLVELLGKHSV